MSEKEAFPARGNHVEDAVERAEQGAAANVESTPNTALSPEEFEREALSHIDALYSGALRLTRHQHDAEDLVQDTYVRAFRASTSFKAGTNMRAWLFRIMHNAFISSYRKAQRRPKESGGEQVEDWQLARAASHDSTGLRSAETEALALLPEGDIQDALNDLREDYREAVYLADVEGFSYKEIAEIMGTPIGTVMSRIHRGRGLLRASLEQYARERGYLRDASDADGGDQKA
ncbi:sigma-70 family RNA polymerase sigma factor [Dermabacter vaginalis]|uniref:RNA polymerase sigma factor n=1 Tax=Dermabacter vaginalis TaxID=1630135 RepID=A0ABX6A3B1_9MICO|nr:sigma-70 family RNA polymerase sigma factor [Dermabacter vaginalis]MCG7442923.1 sigma-70 family RNA polymerase sigma factor [Dermabacter vaginalis]QEU11676.1 sigma-70 family RNA polymerase sigma factor [Dermabacter vaginalis]